MDIDVYVMEARLELLEKDHNNIREVLNSAGIASNSTFDQHKRVEELVKRYAGAREEYVEARAHIVELREALEDLLGLFVFNYTRDRNRDAYEDLAEVRDAGDVLNRVRRYLAGEVP